MISEKEYKELRQKDMERAMAVVEGINNSKDPDVKYKESRPITDIKHMFETSCELYAENPAFWVKDKRGGEYRPIKYKEALVDVNGLGTALIAGGFKDKRIAVMGENSYQWAITYLATVCGVGVIVPIDKELSAKEVKNILVSAEVSCVVFDKKHEETFKEIKAEGDTKLECLINMQAESSNNEVLALKELVEAGKNMVLSGNREFLDAQIFTEEMRVLLFTSGTTGASKGVMLSHKNIAHDLMVAPTVLLVKPTDKFFSFLPVHHTYECTCGFLMPLYKGASIAYCEGLKYIVKNLSEASPTFFLGVPAVFENLYKKIWQNIRKKGKENVVRKVIKINKVTKKVGIDLGNIFFKEIRALFGGNMRMIICGGAAINPEVLEGIKAFGVMALQGYGLTEAAPMGALNPDTHAKSASIGKAFPNCDIKIANKDEEGIGEICLKGDNIMIGYYNMPEETANVIKDGWFHTGDLGYMDDEGFVYITGRQKNVIITKNGKNVYPEELEYLLSNSPIVLESMVWSKESEDGEDTLIVASIRPDMEMIEEKFGRVLSDEEIAAELWKEVNAINEELPFYKKIKNVILRKEEFEKNTTKKIKRFAEGNKQ